MAISSSTGAAAPGKSCLHSFPSDLVPPIINGLVQDPSLSPSTQVQILSVVDAMGSATIGDIIGELPGHTDPVTAILTLVRAGILTLDVRGVVDANTVASRIPTDPDLSRPCTSPTPTPIHPVGPAITLPKGVERFQAVPFSAQLTIGTGPARRDFSRLDELQRPGVYILLNTASAYVGVGGNVASRIGYGQQPIQDVETVISITDANDTLSHDDAKALERMLWSRVVASGAYEMLNGVPDGATLDPQRYSELECFLAEACLALRHADILFTEGTARSVITGPRCEPSRLGKPRLFDEMPNGDILELKFSGNLVALAARQTENRWLLLSGSDVRVGTVASANGTTGFLRSAWLHAGLLAPSADGQSYTTTTDLVFASGSAVAHFVCGAKSRGLSSWRAIDPDAGYDADTPRLIAA
jgi:hypothetical protein